MAETQTKEAVTQQQPLATQPQRTGQAVARLSPPRLPYHPIIGERFGVDASTWKALCESLYPLARTPDSVCLVLAYCKARNLDPMKKPVHIVPMWNSDLKREVETVWPGITELRITAHRTKEYAGTSPTRFGEWVTKLFKATDSKGKIHECTLRFPEWAEITCYRIVGEVRVEFPGPRVYFEEFYGQIKGLPVPNSRWQRAPSQMLEKCAEAGALRKAFTEELGSEYAAEEMDGRPHDGAIDPKKAPPRPFVDPEATSEFTPANEVVREAEPAPTEVVNEGEPESTARELSPQDQEYEDWLHDQYETLKKCKMTRTVGDLNDEVIRELRNEDVQAWRDACSARVTELEKPKGK